MPAKRVYDLADYDEGSRTIRVLASTRNAVDGEALETWDLTRFSKNPVVLWGHDPTQLPIGRADAIEQGPDGLSMTIKLASEKANPLAGYIAHLLKERILRGVSVGFEPGVARKEIRDGEEVDVRTANELLEVSFVSIPKDEDAGTSAISEAARALATHRAGLRADASEVKEGAAEHLDATLAKVEFTPWGTARIPARISRVGVLDYPGRREFRPPNEVLKPESIATLKGMPVIDIRDHNDFVRPQDFRQKVLGFVEEVHADGEYVAGTLHIHDAATIEAIKRGERLDVSAGYLAPTVKQEGVWRGERYDYVQRDIIYNHVALCPPGRGRAGPEVGLKLDTNTDGNDAGRTETMTTANQEKRFIRLDGKDFEIGSQAHLDKLDDMHKAEVAALKSKIDELSGRLDAAEKAVAAAKREKEEEEEETQSEDEAEKRERTLRDRVRSKVRLVMRALRLFGEDDDEDDDKKMDALCEMSERDLYIKAIRKIDPDFKADGKSDDYLAGLFEGAVDYIAKASGVDGVVRVLEGKRLDSVDNGAGARSGTSTREHPLDRARRENLERMRKMSERSANGGAQ